jgi:hypothetical protein
VRALQLTFPLLLLLLLLLCLVSCSVLLRRVLATWRSS